MTNYVKTKIINLSKITTLSEKYRFRNFKDRMYPFLYDKTCPKAKEVYNFFIYIYKAY